MTRYRLRDIPCIPLLALLHLIFTISSLILRLAESLSSPPSAKVNHKPPRHVALVLASGSAGVHKAASRIRREASARQSRAAVESVKRIVEWAGDVGVEEISVWNEEGLVQDHTAEVLEGMLRLPPSPPSSGASTPTRTPRGSKSAMLSNPITQSHTYTVYPSSEKPISLHLLPLSSTSLLPRIARGHVKDDKLMTQKSLDSEIRTSLGFRGDPDLLIVHHISPPSFFRSLLPRSPPELYGYPFWPLRITEIYQHPTPLPIPSFVRDLFTMLLGRAQLSSLPLVRKTARRISVAESSVLREYASGALRPEEWEGAMNAWSQVEQRLGK